MILTYLDQKKDFLLACMGTYRAELDFQAIGNMPSFSTQKTGGCLFTFPTSFKIISVPGGNHGAHGLTEQGWKPAA